jgi:hypothetical protein
MVARGEEGGRPQTCETRDVTRPDTSDLVIVLPGTPQLIAEVVIAIVAAVVVYAHARRHGSTHATAWSIAAFLAAPFVVPVYFVRYWLKARRSR